MATKLAPPTSDALYEGDFALWAEQQAAHLRAGRFGALDIENVAEEIESLSRSDKREVVSRLATIIEHLLKLAFSADEQPRAGWWHTVRRERHKIEELLQESPSLRPQLPAFATRAWRNAPALAGYGLSAEEAARLPKGPVLGPAELMGVETDAELRALLPR